MRMYLDCIFYPKKSIIKATQIVLHISIYATGINYMSDRGRRPIQFTGLSVPQKARARDDPRDRSRSRGRSRSRDRSTSRDRSPFHGMNSGFPGMMHNEVPIIEDNEMDIELGPILPQFSQTSVRYPDSNDLDAILIPDTNKMEQNDGFNFAYGHTTSKNQDIEEDFQKQFSRDVELKPIVLKRRNVEHKPRDILHADSSSDFSTDSGFEEDDERNDMDELKRNITRHKTNHADDHYDDNDNKPIETESRKSLSDAINYMSQTMDETKPSTIFSWINRKKPPKVSLGQVLSSKSRSGSRSDTVDIESKPGKPKSSRNILTLTNSLIHGKPLEDKFYNNEDYDEILQDMSGVQLNSKNKGNKREVHDGVTSNLMKLYNQIPDSSEDDVFSEFSDLASKKTEAFTSKFNVNERVKSFKGSSIFGSRETSREPKRPSFSRKNSSNSGNIKLPDFSIPKEDKKFKKIKKKTKKQKAARITVHIVDLMHRQEFLLTLCKAFMLFGAPNHRLEEYMALTSKVLEVEATFIYLPGMMLVNFSDPVTRTSDLKLVRVGQGLNLDKLDRSHDIFEAVVYDRMSVDEASTILNELFESKDYFNIYWTILLYGLSSTFILCFFNGAWLDMIPSFILGSILGFLQCVVAPKNAIYSSVFEVGSAILISFVGRAVGSIADGKYFCFSAIVLSGLCMILPGYMILRGALEIQSKSIVSGVVGMFYAIIYSLFLGFGLTLGSALYGWIDKGAYSKTTCSNIGHIDNIWKLLFVPCFNIFQSLACQARWNQISVMVMIANCGYLVTYFSSLHFSLAQFNSALGAFTVGILSNVYDRWGRPFKRFGHCSTKFTSMITGIFDLVPGGFAARNVLSGGLTQLSGTQNGNSTGTDTSAGTLTFGISMIEISIGITVGLFVSTLVVYPFGKRRSEGMSIGL